MSGIRERLSHDLHSRFPQGRVKQVHGMISAMVICFLLPFLLVSCSEKTDGGEHIVLKAFPSRLIYGADEGVKVYSAVEYTGDKDSICLWTGDPMTVVSIYDEAGECVLEGTNMLSLNGTVIKKDRPLFLNGGNIRNYYRNEPEFDLPPGKYTAEVYLKCYISDQYDDDISIADMKDYIYTAKTALEVSDKLLGDGPVLGN